MDDEPVQVQTVSGAPSPEQVVQTVEDIDAPDLESEELDELEAVFGNGLNTLRDLQEKVYERRNKHLENLDRHVATEDHAEARESARLVVQYEDLWEEIRTLQRELVAVSEDTRMAKILLETHETFGECMEVAFKTMEDLAYRISEVTDRAATARSEAAIMRLRVEDARSEMDGKLFHGRALSTSDDDDRIERLIADRKKEIDRDLSALPQNPPGGQAHGPDQGETEPEVAPDA